MSSDPDNPRPSFRFRDKFSRLKEKVKDKLRDKAIKHNVTLYVHQNLTSNETHDRSHHGFRHQMHHFKDVLKNKTHYESIKHKIKDKIDDKFDLHDNKTYPKGFYDSLFSPETENDVYLKTAIICLWVIALLCIIPTIVIIFLPSKKKQRTATSINMIFFHVFLCELFYLSYILLAMINVAKDFRLGSLFCDFANYGMYVTIPIMQFALLFLSLERLSKHFNLTMTWLKIFTKPYLINVILCVIWVILIALLVTFMFIKKQFSFNFLKDKVEGLAPPIVGDVVSKLASRRHHCAVDGRLSSVIKTVIIILFVILIVKPILISLGFNILTPCCCKNKRKEAEKLGDRRTTRLVTIFLLLNFFFSFPFYFTSMFNSVLTRIDSTKDTFTIILKICFVLRIINIIFECLAFYIFERNSWTLLSTLLYYATCKKCPAFNVSSDDEHIYSKDPDVQKLINQTRYPAEDEENEEDGHKKKKKKKKQIVKEKVETKEASESEEDEDDDGAFRKKSKKKIVEEKAETPDEDEEEEEPKPTPKRTKFVKKKTVEKEEDEDDEPKKRKIKKQTKQVESEEEDEDEDEEDEEEEPKQKPKTKRQQSDDEEDEPRYVTVTKRKSRTKQAASDDDVEEEEHETTTTAKRKSRTKKPVSDDEENEEHEITTTAKRKSRTKKAGSDDDEEEPKVTTVTKKKSRPKLEEEEEEEEEVIKKPKTKARHHDVEMRIPNGQPHSTHRHSSAVISPKTTKSVHRHSTPAVINPKRHSTRPSPSPIRDESDDDTASNASHVSGKMIRPSASPEPIRKQRTRSHPTSKEQNRSRTASPNDQRSHSRQKTHPHTTKTKHSHTKKSTTSTKKPKKDRRARILEMSHEV